MHHHLTAQNVLKLPAIGRRTDHFDSSEGAPPGFCLRVTSTDHRSYSLLYRAKRTQRLLRVKLGNVGEVTLAAARDRARDLRAEAQLGIEPVPRRVPTLPTVSAVLSSFIEAHRKTKKTRTTLGYEQMLARLPKALAETAAEHLKPGELRLALDKISSRPVMQNSILRFFKASLRWAAKEEMIPPSPVERMSLPNLQATRDRVLAPREIVAVWRAADLNAPRHPRHGQAVAALFKILFLLGQRLGETLALRWSDLDLTADQPLWTIPANIRKGRLGREKAHILPLPPLAVAVLRDIERVTGKRERVFHKVSYNAREFWTHPVRNLSMEMATEYWKLHDLRRTCATNLGDLGVPDEVVSLVLGHAKKDVTGRVYNLSQRLPELATALARWAGHIERLLAETPNLPTKPPRRKRLPSQPECATERPVQHAATEGRGAGDQPDPVRSPPRRTRVP
jgi:integrase